MKRIITLILALSAAVSLFAQNAGHKFEIGVGYAPFFLVGVEDKIQMPFEGDAYFEWRYDFGNHFDVGAKLDYKYCPVDLFDGNAVRYYGDQHYGALLALADFKFLPGKKVNPFIGVGAGAGFILDVWKSQKVERPEYHDAAKDMLLGAKDPTILFVAAPRIGVELFSHLRLSASVDMSPADTRWPVCFNIGWTF